MIESSNDVIIKLNFATIVAKFSFIITSFEDSIINTNQSIIHKSLLQVCKMAEYSPDKSIVTAEKLEKFRQKPLVGNLVEVSKHS